MAYGGGGGDGGAADMRAQEQDRQNKVQAAVDAINAKFGVGPDLSTTPAPTAPTFDQFNSHNGFQVSTDLNNYAQAQGKYQQDLNAWKASQGTTPIADAKVAREAMYGDIAGATRDTAMRGLDRQFTTASRKNAYGLADSGLLGGSADAEAGGDLQTRYGEGRMQAQQAGDKAAADLRSNDELTRQHLIGLAQSGLDTGTASSLAAGQMGAAADLAKSQTGVSSVGNLFDDMSQAYLTNRTLAARYPNGLPMAGSTGYGTTVFSPSKYNGVSG